MLEQRSEDQQNASVAVIIEQIDGVYASESVSEDDASAGISFEWPDPWQEDDDDLADDNVATSAAPTRSDAFSEASARISLLTTRVHDIRDVLAFRQESGLLAAPWVLTVESADSAADFRVFDSNSSAVPESYVANEPGAGFELAALAEPMTYVVTDLGDDASQQGTLRWAISEANANEGLDTITFGVAGVISPASSLPVITDPVNIDATTAPGFGPAPTVVLDGDAIGDFGVAGLEVQAPGTGIHGLSIVRFSYGIVLKSNDNLVTRSYVGINPSGEEGFGNEVDGIVVDSAEGNFIVQNVLSGNANHGLYITGGGSNIVTGNMIGTDPAGFLDIGNGWDGIRLNSTRDNRIGGIVDADRNIVSGNGLDGVGIVGDIAPATGNRVQGNFIGTDVSGLLALPNLRDGIQLWNVDGAPNGTVTGNRIGGDDAADGNVDGIVRARNVISGNTDGVGVALFGALVISNRVEGNWIGLDAAGKAALPNVLGVNITNPVGGTPADAASGNFIGGLTPGAGNVISGNLLDGVQLGFGTFANSIQGNFIGTDPTGGADPNASRNLGNQLFGIRISDATDNTVGGTTAAARNVIAGNLSHGVAIGPGGLDLPTENNRILGNYIGVLVDGLTAHGNGGSGVYVDNVDRNYIGDADGEAGNVISGNAEHGVQIWGPNAVGNSILGNLIGTDRTGFAALANSAGGVLLQNASETQVGDGSFDGRNVISGNDGSGVEIRGSESTRNLVSNNFIGSAIDGLSDLGNTKHGILISADASDNLIGTREGEGHNVIAFNGALLGPKGYGVQVESGTGNAIRRNSIFDNAGRGINLDEPGSVYAFHLSDLGERDLDGDGFIDVNEDFNDNGVRDLGEPDIDGDGRLDRHNEDVNGNGAIDFPDSDMGANWLQNPVVVTAVSFDAAASKKSITWTLRSAPGDYVIDVYADSGPEPHRSGFGDARDFVESFEVSVTDLRLGVSFTRTFDDVPERAFISATVTDESGNTSEISMVDTDGDSLADAWELHGLDINEDGLIDLELNGVTRHGKAYAADPRHKDIFVEVDAMVGRAPTQATLDLAESGRPGPTTNSEGFDDAPNQLVQNPDGRDGINLHALLDETDIPLQQFTGDLDGDGFTALGEDLDGDGTFDPQNEDIDGDGNLDVNEDLDGDGVRDANEPDVDGDGRLDTVDEDRDEDERLDRGGEDLDRDGQFDRGDPDDQGGYPWLQRIKSNLDPGKKGGFGTVAERREDARTDKEVLAAKALVYRYGLFADEFAMHASRRLSDGTIIQGTTKYIGGIAEIGIPRTIGRVGEPGNDFIVTQGPNIDALSEAGTFMHELGHTLGLRHGGSDGFRYKPNYNSIMNYAWSFPRGPQSVIDDWRLDFSREALDTLDETNLDETKGVSGFVLPYGNDARTTYVFGLEVVIEQGKNADWSQNDKDGDGTADNDTGVAADLNGEQGIVLSGWDDWSSLQYGFRESFDFAAGAVPFDPEVPATFDDLIDLHSIGDGPGSFEFRTTAFEEREDGTFAWIEVVRVGGNRGEVTVDYATADGTAIAGADYDARSGTLRFQDGESRKGFGVFIVDDADPEFDETFGLSLSAPTGGAILGDNTEATLTIVDQVPDPGTFGFADPALSFGEDVGDALLTIERTGGSDGEVTVTVATFDGAAVAGTDYIETTVLLAFEDGETSRSFNVPILDDGFGERDEIFHVEITEVTAGAEVGLGSAAVTILDDEAAAATTFVVTSDADSGPGSLRQAIVDANANPGFDFIEFDIPGDGVQTILLLTTLPAITDAVRLDGYTQPGASENSLWEGSDAVLRIEVTRDISTLIFVPGIPWSDPIRGGIVVEGDDVTIRGLVLNGGLGDAVDIDGAGHFRIEGNYIGSDPAGRRDESARQASFVATTRYGVAVANASDGVIGGAHPGDRNLLFGAGSAEIFLAPTSERIAILGNSIGVQVDGVSAPFVERSGTGVLALGAGHRIGGIGPGEGNTIAFKDRSGVTLGGGSGGVGVSIRGNSIHSNQNKAITLIGDGLYPANGTILYNDPEDADSGNNDLQNYPVLHAASTSAGMTTVSGTLHSTPAANFILDFYASTAIDPSGFGEARQWAGFVDVITDAAGTAEFEVDLAGAFPHGTILTATATNAADSTSELSRRVAVGEVLTGVITVNAVDDVDDGIADDAHTSLREAIHAANNHPGADLIRFDLPSGPHLLQLDHDLPAIVDDATTIDATTDPGYTGIPVLELRGKLPETNLPVEAGLVVRSNDNVVRGLALNSFRWGIIVGFHRGQAVASHGNVLEANVIGTNPAGTSSRSNGIGVLLSQGTFDNRIGGTELWQGNLVSGNGTQIEVNRADDIVIQGNTIGLNKAGTTHLSYSFSAFAQQTGIEAVSSDRIVIGGTAPGAGNLISGGSNGTGVELRGSSDGGLVQGNLIGTRSTGTSKVATDRGIVVRGTGYQIGGTDPGAGNVIAARWRGIEIDAPFGGTGTFAQAVIEGNFIGTDPTGAARLGANAGISVFARTEGGVAGTVIGGTSPGSGNTIANNTTGVLFSLSGTAPILGNSIYANSGLGIDLGGDGVTDNDPGDGDDGPNGLQNFPLLTAASIIGPTITVDGSLDSAAASTFRLEFFANSDDEPSGHGEGERFLGFRDITTDESGAASFTESFEVPVAAGEYVTATATNGDGGTSEFSAAVEAIEPPGVPVAFNDAAATDEDNPVVIDVVANDVDPEGALDPSSVEIVQMPSHGGVSVDPTGSVTYGPDPNFFGSDSFRYTVRDELGTRSNAATVSITVLSVNDSPVAVDDVASTAVDTAVDVEVLANDYDPDGSLDLASVAIVAAPANGLATANPDGTINYAPDASFTGTDRFEYEVADDAGLRSAAATVEVTVLPVISLLATDADASEHGPDEGRFLVGRNGSTTGELIVFYDVAGTAANGVDYTPISGMVAIPAGADEAEVVIEPIDDGAVEGDETVVLSLLPDARSYLIDPAGRTDTVAIADDDLALTVRLEKAINAADPTSPTVEEDADFMPGREVFAGTAAVWTYQLFNESPVEVVVDALTDDAGSPADTSDDFHPILIAGDDDGDGRLDPGEVWLFSSSGVVSYRVVEGSYGNLASVVVSDPISGATGSDDDRNYHVGVNAAPEIAVDQAEVRVGEGEVALNSGTWGDPDGDMVQLSASTGKVHDNGDGTWVWSWETSDGPADSRTVVIAAADGDGGFSETSFALSVENLPPVAVLAGPEVGVPGQPLAWLAAVGDPGISDTLEVSWEFGDGTVLTFRPSDDIGALAPVHVYASTGEYTVRLTVRDADGGVTAAETPVVVATVVLQPGAADPSLTVLRVGGTGEDDRIRFVPQGNRGDVKVLLNGTSLGVFRPTAGIEAFGLAGDDDIELAGGIRLPAFFSGDEGDDRLKGGPEGSLLLGGDGNDLLLGGSGRSVLIGGQGSDRLVGGADEDILIGGDTTYGRDAESMRAVYLEWTRTGADFAERRRHLIEGGGLNGDVVLDAAAVVDDWASDVLTGASGADWFLAGQADRITGPADANGPADGPVARKPTTR